MDDSPGGDISNRWLIIFTGSRRLAKNKLVVGSQARILYADARGQD